MGILQSILNRLTQEEKPASRRWFVHPRRTAGQRIDHDTALTYSAVWRAVNLIASGVAVLPWHVMARERDQNGRKTTQHLFGHPAQALLDVAANEEMDAFQFKRTIVGHALTWGNGYAEIEFDNSNRPRNLFLINPAKVTASRDEAGQLWYEVDNDSAGKTYLRPENMFHVKGLGFDGLTGYSVISYAARSVGLGLATEKFGADFFANGANASLILEHPGQLGDQAMQHLKDSLMESSGGDNRHAPMILEEGLKAQQISIPPDDAQFLQTRQHNVDDVARWYGVPPHKLMQMEKSSFSNIEQQNIEFATDTLAPWSKTLELEASMKLISRAERRRVYTKMNLNAIMRGDMNSRKDFYRTMFDMGVYSPNDILELEDRNPIGPDGDKRFVQLNLTTLDKAGEEQEPPPAPPPVDDPEPENKAALAIMGEIAERINTREAQRVNHILNRHPDNVAKFNQALEKFIADHGAYLDKILEPARAAFGYHFSAVDIDGMINELRSHAADCYENGENYSNSITAGTLIEVGTHEVHE